MNIWYIYTYGSELAKMKQIAQTSLELEMFCSQLRSLEIHKQR